MPRESTLIVVAGPTAVGKTELSIKLAEYFQCPIISFDSRQVYREMTIGTAKPSDEELQRAQHYFINSHTVKERYTAGMYELEALELLEEIFKSYPICIAVGGSGLYIDALCYGIDDIPTDENIRQEIEQKWKTKGLEALQKELLAIDPEFYHQTDIKNPRRVMRGLEVYHTTGTPYSVWRKNKPKERPFKTIWIGLKMEIEKLYERINQRVDIMIDQGLVDEVKNLEEFRNQKALKTVGYREIFDHLDGKISLEKAIEEIKKNTRRYAKRQLTWFRKNPDVKWFKPDETDLIVQFLGERIN